MAGQGRAGALRRESVAALGKRPYHMAAEKARAAEDRHQRVEEELLVIRALFAFGGVCCSQYRIDGLEAAAPGEGGESVRSAVFRGNVDKVRSGPLTVPAPAQVAESVDALVSGTSAARRGGSSLSWAPFASGLSAHAADSSMMAIRPGAVTIAEGNSVFLISVHAAAACWAAAWYLARPSSTSPIHTKRPCSIIMTLLQNSLMRYSPWVAKTRMPVACMNSLSR